MKDNLFFYSNIPYFDTSHGIRNKVLDQVDALEKLGFNVYYTVYLESGVAIVTPEKKIIEKKYYVNKRIFRYYRRYALIDFVADFISSTEISFQYAYLRYHYFDNKYKTMLRNMKSKNIVTIVEAHGYPVLDPKSAKKWPLILQDIIYEKKNTKYIDAVAAISNVDNIWGCKTIHIDNSVNLEKIPYLQPKKISSPIILFCASYEREYHGYRKLISSMKRYYDSEKPKKNDYQIIFAGVYSKKTIQLVSDLNLEDRISFVGKVHHHELELYLQKTDLALGSFNPHGGTDHGSSIKSKEYFAYGIPFLNGWKEYGFDDTYPYVKRFDVFENFINFNEVDEFIEFLRGKENTYRIEMREFANKHFTWEKQFQRIFKGFIN